MDIVMNVALLGLDSVALQRVACCLAKPGSCVQTYEQWLSNRQQCGMHFILVGRQVTTQEIHRHQHSKTWHKVIWVDDDVEDVSSRRNLTTVTQSLVKYYQSTADFRIIASMGDEDLTVAANRINQHLLAYKDLMILQSRQGEKTAI